MYRLAIIDDEHATRQGLQTMLDWEKLDIEIVGEAEDGFQGQALVATQRPDIIICDVRMPKLDGIALVAQLRPTFPDLQVIFLSGHSEKAYLRSAIRFGAVDYLDKPVQPEELTAVLEKAKERLAESHNNRPLQTFQAQMVALLGGKGGQQTSLPRGLPVPFDQPYCVAVFTFGFPAQEADPSGLFLQQQLPLYCQALQEACSGKALLHALGNHFVGYFTPWRGFAPAGLGKALASALPKAWPRTCLSLSSPHTGIQSIPAAYQQAQEANRSFFNGFGMCYAYDSRHQADAFPTRGEALTKITEQVEAQAFARAAEMLDSYIQRLKGCPTQDEDKIRKELARFALRMAKQYHPEDEAYQFSVLEHITFQCLTLEDIRSDLQSLLSTLVSSLDSLSSKGRVIYDIQRYIQANYAKDLSIADIAGQVYLTPTYLCYLYKKSTGQTLNEYITSVKMHKAKDLLKNHALKLADIAKMLGYHSPNYFTRAFTKHWGASPTAYRNQHL